MRQHVGRLLFMFGAGFVVLLSFQNCGESIEGPALTQEVDNLAAQDQISEPPGQPDPVINQDDNPGPPNPNPTPPTPNPTPTTKTCKKSDLPLRWPLAGNQGSHWTINNFVDLAAAKNDLKDYTGKVNKAAKTYDGHTGIDIDVANFRMMDSSTPIYASADGVVEKVSDGKSDRNMACESEIWNAVQIRHANGFATIYGHLKKGSVAVSVGQSVKAGQKIGTVGSSGCSYHPHLHFEVEDCAGATVDPMQSKMFSPAPAYASPLTLMDVAVRTGKFSSYKAIQDPPAKNVTSVRSKQAFAVALYVAGSKAGDVYQLRCVDPKGKAGCTPKVTLTSDFDLSLWSFDLSLAEKGAWKIRVLLNGEQKHLISLDVE